MVETESRSAVFLCALLQISGHAGLTEVLIHGIQDDPCRVQGAIRPCGAIVENLAALGILFLSLFRIVKVRVGPYPKNHARNSTRPTVCVEAAW